MTALAKWRPDPDSPKGTATTKQQRRLTWPQRIIFTFVYLVWCWLVVEIIVLLGS